MIPLFRVHLPESVDEPLLEVLHSGWIGQGVKVDKFEDNLKNRLNNPYVLSLNNGTAGLHIALRLAEVGYDDEVITSPMTCLATATPIVREGAVPVWCDIDPKTGNIDPNKIEELITLRTRAILCVHWGGYPCDLEEINEIAEDYGLYVIEDAAQALGATYKGKPIGSISDFTEFSLQAIKVITTIDGGILTCKDEDDYRRGKLLRWYGLDREIVGREARLLNDVPECGWKMNMTDVPAIVGLEQLKYLDGILKKHRANAEYYNNEFSNRNIKRVKPLSYTKDRQGTHWLYTVLVEDKEDFRKFMEERKIGVGQPHVRIDTYSCFDKFQRDDLVGVTEFSDHQTCVPVGWWLSEEDRESIIDAIEEWDNLG